MLLSEETQQRLYSGKPGRVISDAPSCPEPVENLLKHDPVLPAIAEVVLVLQS